MPYSFTTKTFKICEREVNYQIIRYKILDIRKCKDYLSKLHNKAMYI